MEELTGGLIVALKLIKNIRIIMIINNTFSIVQGSTYSELRKESAHFISEKNAAGNAIGGLSVGEPLKKCTQWLTRCEILPKDKPRYLMGVGTQRIF